MTSLSPGEINYHILTGRHVHNRFQKWKPTSVAGRDLYRASLLVDRVYRDGRSEISQLLLKARPPPRSSSRLRRGVPETRQCLRSWACGACNHSELVEFLVFVQIACLGCLRSLWEPGTKHVAPFSRV